MFLFPLIFRPYYASQSKPNIPLNLEAYIPKLAMQKVVCVIGFLQCQTTLSINRNERWLLESKLHNQPNFTFKANFHPLPLSQLNSRTVFKTAVPFTFLKFSQGELA